eukprot:jgi/Botrbrau1/9870/Bobra.0080s0005.2
MYLDPARIHVTCTRDAKERMSLIRIIREGGATREGNLKDKVTHIVVGGDVTMEEANVIRQHMSEFSGQCRLASADWLLACGAARRLLPVEGAHVIRPTDLLARVRQSEGLSQPALGPAQPSQVPVPGGAFEGCYFTLLALQGEPGDIAGLIRQRILLNGGRMFSELTCTTVPKTAEKYAVCPVSFPSFKAAAIQNCPDWRMVPERRRVTPHWVLWSIHVGSPVKAIPRDRVLCRPLPYALPLPEFTIVKVTASGMPQDAKESVREVVKELGGRYSANMGHSATHLIVPYQEGEKFKHAAEYSVTPVTADWLIDCALQGKLLPEKRYYPPPAPVGLENVFASQFPGQATQGGGTQLAHAPPSSAGPHASVMRPPLQALPQPTAEGGPSGARGRGFADTLADPPVPSLPVPPGTNAHLGSQPAPKPPSLLQKVKAAAAARRAQNAPAEPHLFRSPRSKDGALGGALPDRAPTGSQTAAVLEAATAPQAQRGDPRGQATVADGEDAAQFCPVEIEPGADLGGPGSQGKELEDALHRLVGHLENVAVPAEEASQPDFGLPPPPGDLSGVSGASGAGSGASAQALPRGRRRPGQGTTEGGPPRKRPPGYGRGKAGRRDRSPADLDLGSQMVPSQWVGYAGRELDAEQQMVRRAPIERQDKDQAKRQLAGVVTRSSGKVADPLKDMGLM